MKLKNTNDDHFEGHHVVPRCLRMLETHPVLGANMPSLDRAPAFFAVFPWQTARIPINPPNRLLLKTRLMGIRTSELNSRWSQGGSRIFRKTARLSCEVRKDHPRRSLSCTRHGLHLVSPRICFFLPYIHGSLASSVLCRQHKLA